MQNTYLDALGTLPDTILHFGNYLKKNQRCKACNSTWITYEEKMTDINIAVKLLVDAQDDRFDTAIIVSADSDLSPPIDSLLKRNPMKRVVVAFPPKRSSNALKYIASAWTSIDRKTLKNSQFPQYVKTADGFSLRQPQEWT